MITNIYSKSYIQSSASAEAQSKVILFERLLPILSRATSGAESSVGLDVFSLYLAATMDFISAYIFGVASSSNFLDDRAVRDHVLALYRCRGENTFFRQELPGVNAFCKKLGIHLCPKRADAANKALEAWNKSHCDKAMRHLESTGGDLSGTADDPVVLKAVLAGIEKEEKNHGQQSLLYPTALLHRDISVASEVFDHILAGQETAGLAMTYLTWHMSQDQDLQRRLRDELLSIEPNLRLRDDGARSLPDPKELDALPLLHAIMMETLRLNAPIGGPEPRRTPFPQCHIGPYAVPGGVRIAALAHTLHRDESVFPDCEKWDPTRWLLPEGDEKTGRLRNRQFWAFGSGGRMCIGSNFAVKGESDIHNTLKIFVHH